MSGSALANSSAPSSWSGFRRAPPAGNLGKSSRLVGHCSWRRSMILISASPPKSSLVLELKCLLHHLCLDPVHQGCSGRPAKVLCVYMEPILLGGGSISPGEEPALGAAVRVLQARQHPEHRAPSWSLHPLPFFSESPARWSQGPPLLLPPRGRRASHPARHPWSVPLQEEKQTPEAETEGNRRVRGIHT